METRNDSVDGQEILRALTALRDGDFTRLLPEEGQEGVQAEIARTYNDLVRRLNVFAVEVTRLTREMGTDGRFGGQIAVDGLTGTWADLATNANLMARNLTIQFRGIATIVTARANGDMTTRLLINGQGEVRELQETLNVMGDQFGALASEVTRVSRETGTEGRFGGQAEVPGLAGSWKDLADGFNGMVASLTNQVRDFARTTEGIVGGNPTRRATVGADGETRALKETINALAERASGS